MRGKFKPGEKVMIADKPCVIISRHLYKKKVWFVMTSNGKSGAFDEVDITKTETIQEELLSPKKQAHVRNAEKRQKHSKKGVRRDFLMLEE